MKPNIFSSFFLTTLGAIALASIAPSPATASPTSTVRSLKASQVTGRQAQLQTVKAWPGHGVSISFFETGEVIRRAWLDRSKKSKFIIDVDGCLSGLGRDCENPGAGLIHISAIDGVTIPGLPNAPYGEHLTVITESNGQKKSYHFRLVAGTGVPEYSEILIENDLEPTLEESSKPRPNPYAAADAQWVTRGMQVALSNKWIDAQGSLWQRLTHLVGELQSGADANAAAAKAGVSMQLVEKLMQLGGRRFPTMLPPNGTVSPIPPALSTVPAVTPTPSVPARSTSATHKPTVINSYGR
ncbi:MAG: hypothetical protein CLLPBCKN_007588 [Chroococcidiopsis cubana SAG 39.79]|uniref:Uncharacterized protein n=1 Tax=Chroococcidiopsis cubana SAG 39.79 TaxID=388085 RepID=A0AB37UTB8_9CYAN|nr:hypothetical protein [Chroococcidiopsis cubana]MDZ4878153.1 hypothetical protein [Chroococcidiopsis cubana SAG 39.79]PSB63669.1 hypothetical protein C7B79_12975 [Chroococcidiopsis cubana CCALA 043]RUT14580.1 hypothetical protein DSM107010_01260 [Chroococcidiopsis cubana SAG 39.79]